MDTNYLENNYLTLVGKVTGEKKFSHEIYGESFYIFNLMIPRLSGNSDIIPITVSERLIKEDTLQEGNKLRECRGGENGTEQEKNRPRESSDWRGLMEKNPGGDLLLRDLSSDYHWRGSVSLPGSERDRVGPLRSGHRASGGRGDFFFILPAREPCFFGGF